MKNFANVVQFPNWQNTASIWLPVYHQNPLKKGAINYLEAQKHCRPRPHIGILEKEVTPLKSAKIGVSFPVSATWQSCFKRTSCSVASILDEYLLSEKSNPIRSPHQINPRSPLRFEYENRREEAIPLTKENIFFGEHKSFLTKILMIRTTEGNLEPLTNWWVSLSIYYVLNLGCFLWFLFLRDANSSKLKKGSLKNKPSIWTDWLRLRIIGLRCKRAELRQ